MDYNYIKTEKLDDGIVELTLNRPLKRNALCIDLMYEICEFYRSTKERVIILTGEGPAFCAGLDLEEVQDPEKIEDSAESITDMLRTVYESPVISIAAVHGAAVAGGAGLMTACDLAVAAEGTLFGYPETRRGLVAALVMPYLLRQISIRHAQELLLLGEYINAKRALEIGLVNRVVPPGELLSQALAMGRLVLKGKPLATSQTKELCRLVLSDSRVDEMVQEFHYLSRSSDEARAGVKEFLERRKSER